MDLADQLENKRAKVEELRELLASASVGVVDAVERFAGEWWESCTRRIVREHYVNGTLPEGCVPALKRAVRDLQSEGRELTQKHMAPYFVHEEEDVELSTAAFASGSVKHPTQSDRFVKPLRVLLGVLAPPLEAAGLASEAAAFDAGGYKFHVDVSADVIEAVRRYEDLLKLTVRAIQECGQLEQEHKRLEADRLWDDA